MDYEKLPSGPMMWGGRRYPMWSKEAMSWRVAVAVYREMHPGKQITYSDAVSAMAEIFKEGRRS